MPGRLIQHLDTAEAMFGPFGVKPAGIAAWRPRFNVCPGQKVSVVWNQPDGALGVTEMRWGMVRRGGRYGPQKFARSERLTGLKTFEKCRCIVPITGWYEWVEDGGGKKVFCLQPINGQPFALAAIYEDEPEGHTFAVATCEPNGDVRPLHHRMGVFLEPQDYGTWLDANADTEAAKALLRQCPEGWFRHYEISSYVSSPRNEGLRCMEPLKPGLFP